jgi:hypothetical protein
MIEDGSTSAHQQLQELRDQLLRCEQQYFEQLNQQALRLEEANQVIETFENERRQWQAIFEEAQQKQKSLEGERKLWQGILKDAQQKQQALETELQQTHKLLSAERKQWQDIFQDTRQKQKMLEDNLQQLQTERQQWQDIFKEAQASQRELTMALANQKDLLFKADKTIAENNDLIHKMHEWQGCLQSSLKAQLKLLLKTLRARVKN